MAIIYAAQLHPSKTELLDGWAPSQPWFAGESGTPLSSVGGYRFDDPEGEVGVETLLVRAGSGPLLQVPLTYRNAPLDGAEKFLIGTMEHSVLCTRWVYDGAGDPVYVVAAATAALRGGRQADLVVHADGATSLREPTVRVEGRPVPALAVPELCAVDDLEVRNATEETIVEAGSIRLVVARRVGASALVTADAAAGLVSGTWEGQATPEALVAVEPREDA